MIAKNNLNFLFACSTLFLAFDFVLYFPLPSESKSFFITMAKATHFGPFVRTKSKSPGSLFIVAKSLLAKANAI